MGVTSFLPDGIDLFFYLGDLFLISAPFVVRYLCCEFVDLLLVLPAIFQLGVEVDV